MNTQDTSKASDLASAAVLAVQGAEDSLGWAGKFTAQIIRNGEVVDEFEFKNVITNLGKAHILDNYFNTSAFTQSLSMSLIGSTGYTSQPVAADTLASHSNWAEETNYSSATRVSMSSWNAASGTGTVTKSTNSAVQFTMSADKTIKGCMIVYNNTTKGNSGSGTLIAAGLFSADKVLQTNDVLSVTYTASLA